MATEGEVWVGAWPLGTRPGDSRSTVYTGWNSETCLEARESLCTGDVNSTKFNIPVSF